MFRIRAVESPPDAAGLRKVWHRGAKDAELVSEIDRDGHVSRHEFSLFDDVVVWERGRGFVTGSVDTAGSTRGAAKTVFDLTSDSERLARTVQALTSYQGKDRIIGHLRQLVMSATEGGQPVADLGAVTGSNRALDVPAESAPSRFAMSAGLWIGVGLMLIAIAAAVMFLK